MLRTGKHDDTLYIGNYAFYDCIALTSIVIPDSVVYIGNYAFNSASSNETISNYYTASGSWVLQSDGSLKSNTIGHSSSTTYTLTFTRSGKFTYSYKTSTEGGYDKLTVYKNGTATSVAGISGAQSSFTSATIDVIAGDIISFKYVKDGSVTNGNDAVYIKIISFSVELKSNLTRIYFEGNAPTLGAAALPSNTVDEVIVYYNSSKSGWTTPTWNGYECYPMQNN